MIRGEQRVKQIFIFKQQSDHTFALEKRVIVKENEMFRKVCMDFYF